MIRRTGTYDEPDGTDLSPDYFMKITGKGEMYPFASGDKAGNKIKAGRYYIDKESVDKGNRLLFRSLERKKVIILDEIGPLELSGDGWDTFLREWRKKKERPVLAAAVRRNKLEEVIGVYFSGMKVRVVKISGGTSVPPEHNTITPR